MSWFFHGGGMRVYGERDYGPDGSFVTTEWFAVAWVPLIPIISKRISYTRNSNFATYDAEGYYVYETLPLDHKQVFCVYGWVFAFFAPTLVWSKFKDLLARTLGSEDRAAGLFLLTTVFVLALPSVLRRFAKRRKAEEWRREHPAA